MHAKQCMERIQSVDINVFMFPNVNSNGSEFATPNARCPMTIMQNSGRNTSERTLLGNPFRQSSKATCGQPSDGKQRIQQNSFLIRFEGDNLHLLPNLIICPKGFLIVQQAKAHVR